MMILPKYRLIFLHIHKNAGTTVQLQLARLRTTSHKDCWKGQKFHGHVSLLTLLEQAPELTGHRFFVVSRNPWSRLVSTYGWWKSKGPDQIGINSGHVAFITSFSDFLARLEEGRQADPSNPALARRLASARREARILLHPHCLHYPSQLSSILDGEGRPGADHLPIESLSVSLPAYLSQFTTRRIRNLGEVQNRGPKTDWRRTYTDVDAERVARIYAADIAHFGYGFDRQAPS